MSSQDVGWNRATVASRIVRLAVWSAIGVPVLLLFALVVIAPFVTGIPLWMGLLLVVVDGAVLVGALCGLSTLPLRSVALVSGFTAAAVIAVALSQMLAFTPPILNESGRPLSGSIASLEQIELNGSRQWATIRGKSTENPVLLFLAGGPGGSELPSTRLHLGALEDDFIVVNWDQPGAGKSYSAVNIEQLTPERYINDALALVEHLRSRFDKQKVYLMGESWGTILGIWLARDRPDLFHAYVGSGQMVSTTENDVLGYQLALRYLENRGDTERLERLRRRGPPPYRSGNPLLHYADYLDVLNRIMSERAPGEGEDHDILIDAILAPEYGLLDKVNWVRGLVQVFNAVYPQLEDLDLRTQAAELQVPVYFFVGRHDVNAMIPLVEQYYDVLETPHKEIVWFEQSGHTPLYEEPKKWVQTMRTRLLEKSVS